MKQTLIFTALLTTSLALGQSVKKDLTKKQALQLFIKSDARKEVDIKTSQFPIFYKSAKCLSKAYKIPLSQMPIFQEHYNRDEVIPDNGRYRQVLFGLPDAVMPSHDDFGNKTITCNAIHTSK